MSQAQNTPRTCRRCHGTGEYRGYGLCYGCNGYGVIPPSESAGPVDPAYLSILNAREQRASERKARIAARS